MRAIGSTKASPSHTSAYAYTRSFMNAILKSGPLSEQALMEYGHILNYVMNIYTH